MIMIQSRYIVRKAIAQWLFRYETLTFLSFPLSYWNDFIDHQLNNFALLFEENQCSADPSVVLPALIYTNKFILENPVDEILVSSEGTSFFHLLVTGLLVSVKFWGDMSCICNEAFSKIAGISLQEINTLELKFLQGIKYDLLLTENQVSKFVKQLMNASVDPFLRGLVGAPCKVEEEFHLSFIENHFSDLIPS